MGRYIKVWVFKVLALGHLAPGNLALQTIGAWDIWQLGQFLPKTFPVWHLAFRTIGAWIFCAWDISRPRHLAYGLLVVGTIGGWEISCSRHLVSGHLVVGTIGAQDISRPDFWRQGHLALSKRPIFQDISCPDFWHSQKFLQNTIYKRSYNTGTSTKFWAHT